MPLPVTSISLQVVSVTCVVFEAVAVLTGEYVDCCVVCLEFSVPLPTTSDTTKIVSTETCPIHVNSSLLIATSVKF